jgi:hypothetical protein
MISPGAWGVAVVSRSAARLFRRGPGALVEFVAVNDEVHSRHAQGGWSQACFQRGIEEKVAVHVRRVANRLRRAHLRRPFEHLATVASSELRPVIEDSLHGELAELLTRHHRRRRRTRHRRREGADGITSGRARSAGPRTRARRPPRAGTRDRRRKRCQTRRSAPDARPAARRGAPDPGGFKPQRRTLPDRRPALDHRRWEMPTRRYCP